MHEFLEVLFFAFSQSRGAFIHGHCAAPGRTNTSGFCVWASHAVHSWATCAALRDLGLAFGPVTAFIRRTGAAPDFEGLFLRLGQSRGASSWVSIAPRRAANFGWLCFLRWAVTVHSSRATLAPRQVARILSGCFLRWASHAVHHPRPLGQSRSAFILDSHFATGSMAAFGVRPALFLRLGQSRGAFIPDHLRCARRTNC
jgi:hypothetical protein